MYQTAWFETLILLINVLILLTRVSNGKLRVKVLFGLSFIIIPIMALSFFTKNDLIAFICIMLGFIMPFFIVKNLKRINILYVCLFYFGVSSAIVNSCEWITGSLKLNSSFIIAIDALINCCLFILCILIGKRVILSKASQQIILIPRNLKILILSSTWFSAIFSFMLSFLFYKLPYSINLVVIEILTAILIIALGIMCPLLIVNNMSSTHYKTVLSDVEKQMQEQVKHYELIAKANTDIRKFRHDFKNLKIGLLGLLSNHDIDGALNLLRDCDKSLNSEYIFFETGNVVADALLSEKHTAALSIGAEIKFEGVIPNNLITPMDICVIFGNALDNALEACECVKSDEKKFITVSSRYNNNFLFITIENPVSNKVCITNNSITTTKADKKSHGIGLYSIQNVITKYSGSMNLKCEDKKFILKIDLDLNYSKNML